MTTVLLAGEEVCGGGPIREDGRSPGVSHPGSLHAPVPLTLSDIFHIERSLQKDAERALLTRQRRIREGLDTVAIDDVITRYAATLTRFRAWRKS